jgi:hypothetical protein
MSVSSSRCHRHGVTTTKVYEPTYGFKLCSCIYLSLIKTLVVKIHKMYRIYAKYIINKLHCFDNTLIVITLVAVNTDISFIKLCINE